MKFEKWGKLKIQFFYFVEGYIYTIYIYNLHYQKKERESENRTFLDYLILVLSHRNLSVSLISF